MNKFFMFFLKRDYKKMLTLNILIAINLISLLYITKNSLYDQFSQNVIFLSLSIAGLMFYYGFRVISLVSNDIFSDEKYFIYTLPISRAKIYVSKILYIYLYFLILTMNMGIVSLLFQKYMNLNIYFYEFYEGFKGYTIFTLLGISFVFLSYYLGKKLFNSKAVSHGILIGVLFSQMMISQYFIFNDFLFKKILTVNVYEFLTLILSLIIFLISYYIFKRTDI